jgi:uncharacterized membrane protein
MMFCMLYSMSTFHAILDSTSHRERAAWLHLIAKGAGYGPYFTLMALQPPTAPLPDVRTMGLFAAAVVVQVIVLAIGHALLALVRPADARAPADERDRAVELRSTKIAYFVLITGMILVGVVMPFSTGGWKLINSAIAAIVIAEFVHYALVIWGYRRGWHG